MSFWGGFSVHKMKKQRTQALKIAKTKDEKRGLTKYGKRVDVIFGTMSRFLF